MCSIPRGSITASKCSVLCCGCLSELNNNTFMVRHTEPKSDSSRLFSVKAPGEGQSTDVLLSVLPRRICGKSFFLIGCCSI